VSPSPAMGRESARDSIQIWKLANSQHGVITRRQLLDAGFSADEVDGRIARGRLHRLWRGVYAVGRPQLTPVGWWSAAVLACGRGAVLSHESAAALWGIRGSNSGSEGERDRPWRTHVSVPARRSPRRAGIRVHRRRDLSGSDQSRCRGIPVTTPARTLIDLSTLLSPNHLEACVNQADRLGLIDPELLRSEIGNHRGMDGVPVLRRILDRRTYRLTDSELERRFLRVIRRGRLPEPLTQRRVNGLRVDFYWPDLRLIVETDGLRYHRTPTQQAKDRVRDQRLLAAGFTVLRFTYAQVAFEPDEVIATLRAVANGVSSGFPAISRTTTRDQA
jgi:very-short-patch-repair endonuclease